MSGHSKWAKIKRQKGVEDQKRGQEFSKLSRVITIAVAQGKSGDPGMNPTLRLAIEKARSINMPKDNIDRAIARGLGGEAGNLEQVMYEGYGPMGVPVIVTASTDNRQRTAATVKNIFERSGGSLGGPGAAIFMFDRTSEGGYQPKAPIPLEGEAKEKVARFVEALTDNEDVDEVFCGANVNE